MATPQQPTGAFPPTGRWEVRSCYDSNYDSLVPVVVDPQGREAGRYEPSGAWHAETNVAFENAKLDGRKGCPYCGPANGCAVCGRLAWEYHPDYPDETGQPEE